MKSISKPISLDSVSGNTQARAGGERFGEGGTCWELKITQANRPSEKVSGHPAPTSLWLTEGHCKEVL